MKLDEWVQEQKELLDKFAEFWKAQAGENVENFPSNLPPGEWDEQYRLWEPR